MCFTINGGSRKFRKKLRKVSDNFLPEVQKLFVCWNSIPKKASQKYFKIELLAPNKKSDLAPF